MPEFYNRYLRTWLEAAGSLPEAVDATRVTDALIAYDAIDAQLVLDKEEARQRLRKELCLTFALHGVPRPDADRIFSLADDAGKWTGKLREPRNKDPIIAAAARAVAQFPGVPYLI